MTQLVTEAYDVLRDDAQREDYDRMLKTAKPTLADSRWAEDAPLDARGVFVDETKCKRCYRCVAIASSTFAVHDNPKREEKAHVVLQYGDTHEIVMEAIKACPTKAISLVSRENLPLWEYAMGKCSALRARCADPDEAPSPHELMQDSIMEELIALDFEKAMEAVVDPLQETRVAEELTKHARAIYAAAVTVPAEVRERLWPETGAQVGLGEEAMGNKMYGEEDRGLTQEGDVLPGMARASLKSSVFRLLDKDMDGFLYANELKPFAEKFGFEGDDLDWEEEYREICSELECNKMTGLDIRTFSQLVDHSFPLETEQLAEFLGESRQLQRASSNA